jgi:hypothetical protein
MRPEVVIAGEITDMINTSGDWDQCNTVTHARRRCSLVSAWPTTLRSCAEAQLRPDQIEAPKAAQSQAVNGKRSFCGS